MKISFWNTKDFNWQPSLMKLPSGEYDFLHQQTIYIWSWLKLAITVYK